MNIKFLEREIKKDKLDKDWLLVPYLMAIRLQAPGLWEEFRSIVAGAEELAAKEEGGAEEIIAEARSLIDRVISGALQEESRATRRQRGVELLRRARLRLLLLERYGKMGGRRGKEPLAPSIRSDDI